MSFYSVSASLIPLLFVTLTFQHRAWIRVPRNPEQSNDPFGFVITSVFSVLLLVLAEAFALRAVIEGHGSTAGFYVVAFGIALGLALATVLTIEEAIEARRETLPAWISDRDGRAREVLLLICVLATALPMLLGVDPP